MNAPLDFSGLPAEFGVQAQQDARKRKVLEAQMADLLGNRPQNFRRNPLAYALDFLRGMDVKDEGRKLDAAETDRSRKASEAQRAEIAAMLAGMQPQTKPQAGPPMEGQDSLPDLQIPGDPIGSLQRGMASPFPGVAKLAGDMHKTRTDSFGKVLSAVGPRADFASIQEAAASMDPAKLRQQQIAPPQFLKEGDQPYALLTKPDGTQDIRFPPKGTSVTTNVGGRAGQEVLKEQGKAFVEGGKEYEKADALAKRLQSLPGVFATLAQDPKMGAGADVFQAARKWAQTLGVKGAEQATSITDLAKMQLGQAVMDRLGGLGVAISDADRQFVMDTQGSLTSDPTALRRMLMWEAGKLMESLNSFNDRSKSVAGRFEDAVDLPQFRYNVRMPNQEYADEFGRILQGDFSAKQNPVAPPKLNAPPGRIKLVP